MSQLRGLVQAGVSQQELGEILTQLHALATPTPAPAPAPPAPVPQSYIAPAAYTSPPPAPSNPPTSYSQPSLAPAFGPAALSRLLPPSQPAPVPSTSTPQPVVPDITNLFSALVKAGVVSATSTPQGAGSSSKPDENMPPVDPEREASRAYRKTILSMKVKLTSSDIMRYVSNHRLY